MGRQQGGRDPWQGSLSLLQPPGVHRAIWFAHCTQGFSGRYKHVDIHKFLLAGQIDSYDLESDEMLRPGEHTCLRRGHARGLTIHPGSWHIEYGRGAVVTTLPFAMVDTLLVSLELESVRRSTVEFAKLVTKRFRR